MVVCVLRLGDMGENIISKGGGGGGGGGGDDG